MTTRLALDHLRALGRRREDYVGPWLPEPLLTAPDVAEDVELAESVSTAMLLVLETLTPPERAVFVLREVFDVPYDEIAGTVGKTPAAVRQIAHRARAHVAARRPRQVVTSGERERVMRRFVAAVAGDDLRALVDVLAPDVVLLTDGGGIRRAALRPIVGVDKVLRFLSGVSVPGTEVAVVDVNGAPGLRVVIDGRLAAIATFTIVDGRVASVHLVRNPDKLRRVDAPVPLTRGP